MTSPRILLIDHDASRGQRLADDLQGAGCVVALQTDGIGLWFKPNADWLITWLPIALSMVLGARTAASLATPRSG